MNQPEGLHCETGLSFKYNWMFFDSSVFHGPEGIDMNKTSNIQILKEWCRKRVLITEPVRTENNNGGGTECSVLC